MRKNTEVLNEMINKFYSSDSLYLDWMGIILNDENSPILYKISDKKIRRIKEEDKNHLAILGKNSYKILMSLKKDYPDLYDQWNNMFAMINLWGKYPDDEMWKAIFEIRDKTLKFINEEKNDKKATR